MDIKTHHVNGLQLAEIVAIGIVIKTAEVRSFQTTGFVWPSSVIFRRIHPQVLTTPYSKVTKQALSTL